MGASILLLILIIIQTYAQVPPNTRYVIDDDNEIAKLLPFPIDVCFLSFWDYQYTRYSCSSNGLEVYRNTWNASSLSDCMANFNGTVTATFNDPVSTTCSKGNFNCTGDDDYLFHNIWQDTFTVGNCDTPSTLLTLPTVTGCFCLDSTSLQTSCSTAYLGSWTRFDDDTACSTAPAVSVMYGNEECYAIYSDALSPSTTQYTRSEIESCTIDGNTVEKTPSPTAQTSNPTTDVPTAVTPSPISWESNFIIDNDWLLHENYPFPMNQCLQTQPVISQFNLDPEYIYYECNAAGDEVTKYKWTKEDMILPNNFDCSNRSVANITVFTLQNDICNPYYFHCNGNENYATATFEAFTGNDCTSDSDKYPLFNLSFATKTCFCNAQSGTSSQLTCTVNESVLSDYSGTTSCVASIDPNPQTQIIAKNDECSLFAQADIGVTVNIYGTLRNCVENKTPTLSPTQMPTTAPTTVNPTTTPTTMNPTAPFPTESPQITTAPPSRSPLPPGQTHPPTTTDPSKALTDSPSMATSINLTSDESSKSGNHGTMLVIIIIVIAVVLAVFCCVSILCLWRKKSKQDTTPKSTSKPKHLEKIKSTDMDEIEINNRGTAEKTEERMNLNAKTDENDHESEDSDTKQKRKRKKKPPKKKKNKDKKENISFEMAPIQNENENENRNGNVAETDNKKEELEMKKGKKTKKKPQKGKKGQKKKTAPKKKEAVVVNMYDIEDDDSDIDVVEYDWGVTQSKKLTQTNDESTEESTEESSHSSQNNNEEKETEYVTRGGD